MSFAQLIEERAAQVTEIAGDLEIDMRLERAATESRRNQFRGWLDKKGTVRARLYIPGEDVSELFGEVYVLTKGDVTEAEATGKNDELAHVVYELPGGVTAVVWAPIEADIDTITLNT